jgi:hypothetical protein
MAPVVVSVFALFLLVCASQGTKCIDARSFSLKFSFISHRNKTGHRTAQERGL